MADEKSESPPTTLLPSQGTPMAASAHPPNAMTDESADRARPMPRPRPSAQAAEPPATTRREMHLDDGVAAHGEANGAPVRRAELTQPVKPHRTASPPGDRNRADTTTRNHPTGTFSGSGGMTNGHTTGVAPHPRPMPRHNGQNQARPD